MNQKLLDHWWGCTIDMKRVAVHEMLFMIPCHNSNQSVSSERILSKSV
jgi:hypothetical protein